MTEVTLDRSALQALASDTRLSIMRALQKRQKTVTELSRELGLNKATVFQHLDKLKTAGLVDKKEDHRKWVYYKLSYKGNRLLHPGMSFALVLSTAALSLLGASGALVGYLGDLGSAVGGGDTGDRPDGEPGGGFGGPGGEPTPEPDPEPEPSPTPETGAEGSGSDVFLTVALVLMALTILLSLTAWYLYRRHQKARVELGSI